MILSRLYKIIFFSLVVFSLLLIYPKSLRAQSIFEENFNSSPTLSTWDLQNPWGSWSIQNNELVGSVTLNGYPEQASYATFGNYDWQNYSFEVDVKGVKGVNKNILFYINSEGKTYGVLLLSPFFNGGNNLIVYKRNNIGTNPASIIGNVVQFNNNINTSYHLKIVTESLAEGSNIKVFVNQQKLFDETDSINPIKNGKAGFEIWPGGYSIPVIGNETVTSYDNIVMNNISAPTLSVPDLKQYDPSWREEIYDTATDWTNNPTIERWGCALTSATMVLQYHGHQIYPDMLNTWLISQPDGYIRNGLVNWLAISRYTLLNQTPSSPTLEFTRNPASDTLLTDKINLGLPTILKIPGHFITAIGTQNNDFTVNDPASTNTLLSQVQTQRGENYTEIYNYTPSNTDLSYIMLVINNDFDINVLDTNGDPINGSYSIEEPITDDMEGSSSGEPLGIFLYPKPTHGQYQVEINGEGTYQMDSYVYDTSGNVTQDQSSGVASTNQPDQLTIAIGETNQVVAISTFESIKLDIQYAYENGLITNRSIYKNLTNLLNLGNRYYTKGGFFARYGMRLLGVLSKQIHYYTPYYIDPTISEILTSSINALINSL